MNKSSFLWPSKLTLHVIDVVTEIKSKIACYHWVSSFLYMNCVFVLPDDVSTIASDCEHGSVRLGDATDDERESFRWGRVEVCLNRAWGTVCNRLFNPPDARVFCNQLPGFTAQGKQEAKGPLLNYCCYHCPSIMVSLSC